MSHPDRHGPPDARLQLLVAEYTWVAGLDRYYREVELKALAGTGLVLSGVGAAFAALRAADSPDADAAIGVVLAIGAAITAFVLPVVLMASMRGLRAVVYVREWLHPLAGELAQDARFLAWETVSGELYAGLAGRFGRSSGPCCRRRWSCSSSAGPPSRSSPRRGSWRRRPGRAPSPAPRRRAICCSSPPRSASRASPTTAGACPRSCAPSSWRARRSGRVPARPRATRLAGMPRSHPVDGFSLAYDVAGAGTAVVLLHGWPGDRRDHRALAPRLARSARVIVPDLRGFGGSDKHREPPAEAYSAAAQARSVVGLLDELGVEAAVLAGYDVGSRIAQTVAREAPGRVRALVVAPPLPGAGERVLSPAAQREFWYQPFHQLELAEALVDGNRTAVRAYLRHFWAHWSGPTFVLDDAALDLLVETYGAPGAFTASIAWYRAGSGMVAQSLAETAPEPRDRIAVPTTVLWPEHDPLFPPAWSDRLAAFFADVTLQRLPGAGHFTPLEAPDAFAAAIERRLAG